MRSNSSEPEARRILLPRFIVTQTASHSDDGAQVVPAPVSDVTPDGCYYVNAVCIEGESERRDGKPRWVPHQANLYPVVLEASGMPWAEANLYLLLRLENTLLPVMGTLISIADDLAAYRKFLDTHNLAWTDFPVSKLRRPTYRYNAHLRFAVASGDVASSTAKRRMSSVVLFYRWLITAGVFTPNQEPWKESDIFVEMKGAIGSRFSKRVQTTDLAIRTPSQQDPYAGTIDDGGKLRPLPIEEQEWLTQALAACGNPEMTLIHLVAWLTGARIQTVLTLRVQHLDKIGVNSTEQEVRIAVGPGTGIDTKNDKRMVLHMPAWLHERLRVYSQSERAKRRRLKAKGGDHLGQYLFLSIRGAPLYQSKSETRSFNPTNKLRHSKAGQAVRQFIAERLLPFIRKTYASPHFHFQFHDLRATYGMNLTDSQLALVASGKASLHQVREYVKTRMGHESAATTDRYLQFRQHQELTRTTRTQYEIHLDTLAKSAGNFNAK